MSRCPLEGHEYHQAQMVGHVLKSPPGHSALASCAAQGEDVSFLTIFPKSVGNPLHAHKSEERIRVMGVGRDLTGDFGVTLQIFNDLV